MIENSYGFTITFKKDGFVVTTPYSITYCDDLEQVVDDIEVVLDNIMEVRNYEKQKKR